MVTPEEFDHVQLLLGRDGKPHPKKHYFAFTGAIRCGECGCLVTAETKKKHIKSTGEMKEYCYYHCTHKRKDMKCFQRKSTLDLGLELLIEQELEKYTILPEFRDWALEALNGANDKEIETRTKIHESLNKAIMSTQGELDELTKMRYRNLIDDERFLSEKTKLEKNIADLRGKLRGTEVRADKWLELTEKTFNFATYARIAFMQGDHQKKREILLTLGSNRILQNQKLSITAYDWFAEIGKDAAKLTEEYKRVRTDKKLSDKARTEAIASVRTNWLGKRDSNPRMQGPEPCALPLGDSPVLGGSALRPKLLPQV